MSADLDTPITEAGVRLLTRELWEWLPEAYQMSHAKLAEVIIRIEQEARAAVIRERDEAQMEFADCLIARDAAIRRAEEAGRAIWTLWGSRNLRGPEIETRWDDALELVGGCRICHHAIGDATVCYENVGGASPEPCLCSHDPRAALRSQESQKPRETET